MAYYQNKDEGNQEIIKKFHIGSINSHGNLKVNLIYASCGQGAWTDQMENKRWIRKGVEHFYALISEKMKESAIEGNIQN